MLNRRSMLSGCLASTAALAMSGCGGSSGGSGGSAKKTTVTFLNWEATEGTPLGDAIHQFEKQNPDVTVNIQPAATSNYDTKMRTALAGGSPPDVFRINDDFVQQFTANGALKDLSPYVKRDKLNTADYAKQVFEFGLQSDGRMTSWQLGYQPAVVFYNKDMFKAAGVPLPPTTWTADGWTWDDFLKAAQRLTKGTTQYGAVVVASTNYEQTFSHNNGSATGIWGKDGKTFTLADPKGTEAVQWVTDLTCKHKVQPPWSNLQQSNADVQMFAQGKVAMMFELSGSLPYLKKTIKDFEWDIAPPPARVDQATEASDVVFAIPSNGKHPDAAWRLLKYLTSEEGGQIVGKGNAYVPVNTKAAKALYAKQSGTPAHAQLLAEASQHLTATSKTSNTLGARQIYRPALDAVYNCKTSASSALQAVKSRVEAALQRG